jgi:hypothetical protein
VYFYSCISEQTSGRESQPVPSCLCALLGLFVSLTPPPTPTPPPHPHPPPPPPPTDGYRLATCLSISQHKKVLVLVFHPTHLRLNFDLRPLQMVSLREYWIIYIGPGFLAFVWLGSSPTPSPSPVSKVSLFLRLLVCRRSSLRTGEGEDVGEEPSNTTARMQGPLYIIRYSLVDVLVFPHSATFHFLPKSFFTILKYEVHSILSILEQNESIPSRIWSIRYSYYKRHRKYFILSS